MIYAGCDPGKHGTISLITETNLITALRFDKDFDLVLSTLRELPKDTKILVEDVHAVYGSSATATFSFGREVGRIIGILQALDLEFRMVTPREWQTAVCKMPVPPKKGDTSATEHAKNKRLHRIALKRESCKAAHTAFPELSTKHSDVCDSVNIARYCREQWNILS